MAFVERWDSLSAELELSILGYVFQDEDPIDYVKFDELLQQLHPLLFGKFADAAIAIEAFYTNNTIMLYSTFGPQAVEQGYKMPPPYHREFVRKLEVYMVPHPTQWMVFSSFFRALDLKSAYPSLGKFKVTVDGCFTKRSMLNMSETQGEDAFIVIRRFLGKLGQVGAWFYEQHPETQALRLDVPQLEVCFVLWNAQVVGAFVYQFTTAGFAAKAIKTVVDSTTIGGGAEGEGRGVETTIVAGGAMCVKRMRL